MSRWILLQHSYHHYTYRVNTLPDLKNRWETINWMIHMRWNGEKGSQALERLNWRWVYSQVIWRSIIISSKSVKKRFKCILNISIKDACEYSRVLPGSPGEISEFAWNPTLNQLQGSSTLLTIIGPVLNHGTKTTDSHFTRTYRFGKPFTPECTITLMDKSIRTDHSQIVRTSIIYNCGEKR